jgi:hypothetical protein
LWPFGLFYGHLVYFTAIWSILRPFGIFVGHFAYFVVIWYMSPRLGKLHQEKSGIPASNKGVPGADAGKVGLRAPNAPADDAAEEVAAVVALHDEGASGIALKFKISTAKLEKLRTKFNIFFFFFFKGCPGWSYDFVYLASSSSYSNVGVCKVSSSVLFKEMASGDHFVCLARGFESRQV